MLEYQEYKIQLTLYTNIKDRIAKAKWPKSALIGANDIFTTDINDSRTQPAVNSFGNPILCDSN